MSESSTPVPMAEETTQNVSRQATMKRFIKWLITPRFTLKRFVFMAAFVALRAALSGFDKSDQEQRQEHAGATKTEAKAQVVETQKDEDKPGLIRGAIEEKAAQNKSLKSVVEAFKKGSKNEPWYKQHVEDVKWNTFAVDEVGIETDLSADAAADEKTICDAFRSYVAEGASVVIKVFGIEHLESVRPDGSKKVTDLHPTITRC